MTRLTRAESQARTRTQLLATARELFLREGYLATSLDKVADAAGFSKGAVYSNFRNKDQLCLAVLDEVRAERAAEVTDLVRAAGTEERLRRFEEWAERVIGDPQWTTLELEFAVAARRNPELREQLADRLAAVTQVVESAVAGLTADAGVGDSRGATAESGGGGRGTADGDFGEYRGDTGGPGTGGDDTSGPDFGNPDTGSPETSSPDNGRSDIGGPDIGGPDTGSPDMGGHRTDGNGGDRNGSDGNGDDGGDGNSGTGNSRDGSRANGSDGNASGDNGGNGSGGNGGNVGRGSGSDVGPAAGGAPMAVDQAAVSLLCLGVGLGFFRAIDPSMPVSALVGAVRVLAGLPAEG